MDNNPKLWPGFAHFDDFLSTAKTAQIIYSNNLTQKYCPAIARDRWSNNSNFLIVTNCCYIYGLIPRHRTQNDAQG